MDTPVKDAAKSGNESTLAEASDDESGHPKSVAIVEPRTRPRRRATGPRTAIGKRKSSVNAQTYGIFSKTLLVGDESLREFKRILEGLHEDLRPEGTIETLLVETLATIVWRRRRVLRAESAQIEDAIQFSRIDAHIEEKSQAWECARAGESQGGMLKNVKNPYVLGSSIEILKLFRSGFEQFGFQVDPWILRKLYGLDHDNGVPWSLFKFYLGFRHGVENYSKMENISIESIDAAKKMMMQAIDAEIEHLEKLKEALELVESERSAFRSIAALVPPPAVSERLLRYETHLSREFDRTLSQLERLQRMRLGQPVLPPISVRLSG